MQRQLKKEVKIGNIKIGGTNPIAVQTMLNVPVKDIAGNVAQAERVAKAGDDAPALALETPGGPVVSPEPLGMLGARDADGRAAVESMQEEASWSKSGTT